ncbi:MAG: YraN family protein [Candidatus Zophobacter franzmannii]|nr:YraN family protein [Candidatus Zophobacter franzmannii]
MKNDLGTTGELISVNYLTGKGYQILSKNYYCLYGEVDIIAKKGMAVTFCEVKTRTNTPFDQIQTSVSINKQRKISKTASVYLSNHPEFDDFEISFDIILCNFISRFNQFKIKHIPDAFYYIDF